jgi:hypothetical protein
MMALEPVTNLDEFTVETQATWSHGFQTASTPARGKLPRPDKYGRIHSRTALIAKITQAAYEELLENRLRQVPHPPRFTPESVLATLKLRDQEPGLKELKHRIDAETAKLQEVWQERLQRGGSALLEAGREHLREEIQSLRRRSKLFLQQRARHFHWVMVCLMQGDIGPSIASELARAFLWESVQIRLSDSAVLPLAWDAAQRARSRKELDGVVREMHMKLRIGVESDLAMSARERVILFIDIWNSKQLDDVHRAKRWNVEVLRHSDLTLLVEKMLVTTDGLSRNLLDAFGRDRVDSALEPDSSDRTFAGALFESLVEEEPA